MIRGDEQPEIVAMKLHFHLVLLNVKEQVKN